MDVRLIWSYSHFSISHAKENGTAFVILWALKLKNKPFSVHFLCDKCRIYQKFLFFSSSGSNTHISQVSAHFLCKTSQSIPPQTSKLDNMWTIIRADFVNLHNCYKNSFSWAPMYVISVKVATLTMEFLDIPYRNINNCSFIHSQILFSLFQIHKLTPFCFCRGHHTAVLKQSNVRCSRLSDNNDKF